MRMRRPCYSVRPGPGSAADQMISDVYGVGAVSSLPAHNGPNKSPPPAPHLSEVSISILTLH